MIITTIKNNENKIRKGKGGGAYRYTRAHGGVWQAISTSMRVYCVQMRSRSINSSENEGRGNVAFNTKHEQGRYDILSWLLL